MNVEAEDVVDVEETEDDQELTQLVTFSIGEEQFGVNILQVQEIIRTLDITNVPRAPEFVAGVINLRGKVIPIVDMRCRFGLESKKHDKNTRMIVIENETLVVGFVVDSVSEALRIPASAVQPPPPTVAGLDSNYIDGVGKFDDRLLILLNLDTLFDNSELKAMSGG